MRVHSTGPEELLIFIKYGLMAILRPVHVPLAFSMKTVRTVVHRVPVMGEAKRRKLAAQRSEAVSASPGSRRHDWRHLRPWRHAAATRIREPSYPWPYRL